MEHLFISFSGDIELVASEVFRALGARNFVEGDTANTPSGVYFEQAVFGVVLKVEENVYDFEDQFEFMLSIKLDSLTNLNVPSDFPTVVADLVSRMLANNMEAKIGIEVGDDVRVIEP